MPETEKRESAHWIHDTRPDKSYVGGVALLPSCKCSKCGYQSNMEKPVCPHCGSIMNEDFRITPVAEEAAAKAEKAAGKEKAEPEEKKEEAKNPLKDHVFSPFYVPGTKDLK